MCSRLEREGADVFDQALVVFRGSLRQQLRDPLTLLAMIGLPVLMQPVALFAAGQLRTRDARQGREAVLVVEAPPAFEAMLVPRDRLEVVAEGWGDPEHPEVLARVALTEGDEPVQVHYDSTRSRSDKARRRAARVLKRHRRGDMEQRFSALGIEGHPQDVLPVESEDVASDTEREGGLLGRLLPLILVFLAMNGGITTSLHLVTGERERKTLETLLTARVDRRAVLLGKFGVVVLVSLVTSALAVTTLWACLALGLYDAPGESLAIPTAAMPLLLLLLLPLAVLMAAIFTVVAAYVPDFRTGQFAAVALIFLGLAAGGVAAFPAIQPSAALALVPVTNLALAMREAMVGHYPGVILLITVAATAVHVGLALSLGARLLAREEVLYGGGHSADRRARGQFVPDVIGAFLVALLLLWFLGQRVQTMDLVWGMVFTQVVLVAGTAVGTLVWLGQPLRATLQLRRPAGSDLALAVVAGLGAPGISALVAAAQEPLLPTSSAFMETLERSMSLDVSLPVVLLVFALAPALCEELLFRGALLGLLKRSVRPALACVVVGLLFGALHLHVVRILPTGVLGIVLCVVALRARSLWVPVAIHALHNGFLVLASDQGWFTDPPLWVLLLMAAGSLAAVGLMGRGRPRPAVVP
jgi:sodium transport system permease protein